jgi:hypothetical protein
MHNPVIISKPTDEAFRMEVARHAICEMFPLIDILREREEDYWEMRGVYMRIDTLKSVVLSALDDKKVTPQELANRIFGERGWVRDEAFTPSAL